MKITVYGQPVRELYREGFEKAVNEHIEKRGCAPQVVVPRGQAGEGIPLVCAHESATWVDYRQGSYVIAGY